MIGLLDSFRHLLEDLGAGLGVTDPVSGESVLSLWAQETPKAAAKAKPKGKKAKSKAKPKAKKGKSKGKSKSKGKKSRKKK